ncbi:MAG: hypothetical protein RBR71_12130 [Gudongella sp.]|nr:hypothetical protein [Gudongella sp.]
MSNTNTKILAATMATILLVVAVGGAVIVKEENETDVDGFVITTTFLLANVIVAFALGALVGGVIGWGIGHTDDTANNAEARGKEAAAVANSIGAGLAASTNAMSNYAQIWTLTQEHWVRQAELAASELWGEDETYSPTDILLASGVYHNSEYMMMNAAAQINQNYQLVSDALDTWNGIERYSNKMALEFTLGATKFTSKTNWGATLGTSTTVTSSAADRVYVAAGDLIVYGGSATIRNVYTSETYSLNEGSNDLEDIDGWTDGVYELQTGRQYFGNILEVFEVDAAPVYASMVMEYGTNSRLLQYDDGILLSDGYQYNTVNVSIIPDDASAQTEDMTGLLAEYDDLRNSIMSVMVASVSASTSVWNIYDRAGAASAYLTTLTVPETYENVQLSQAQQEIITVLALEQLADYYKQHSDIKTGNYVLTPGSLSLYIRGDIIDEDGREIAENAIYTPFFCQDTTIAEGSNETSRQAIVAIWDTDPETLSSWDNEVGIESCRLGTLAAGADLYAYELMYGGEIVTTVELEVSDIDIIDPEVLESHRGDDMARASSLTSIIQTILVAGGALLIGLGAYMRSPIAIITGIVALIIGLLAAAAIASVIETVGSWLSGGWF